MREHIISKIPKRSWYLDQDRHRIKLGLSQSFQNLNSLILLMIKLNRSSFQSEVALEKKLREFCRANKIRIRFRKNFPILNKFFGDFVSVHHRFIIEVDGSIHKKPEVRKKDLERDKVLLMAGWKVFRIGFPSFNGIDQVFKWLTAHAEAQKDCPQEFKNKRRAFQEKGLGQVYVEANKMLVGCRIDQSVLKEVRKKNTRLETLRKSYRRKGIRVDF